MTTSQKLQGGENEKLLFKKAPDVSESVIPPTLQSASLFMMKSLCIYQPKTALLSIQTAKDLSGLQLPTGVIMTQKCNVTVVTKPNLRKGRVLIFQ